MYRIHWLDLLDQRWANVFSPHYHMLLEYVGYHLLNQHWPMCVVCTIIGCLNTLAIICWTNIWPMCVVPTIIGCLNTLAGICWANIGSMCVVCTFIIGYHLFDQPLGNVYNLHYHNLLEYVSQKAWWLYDWYWLELELQRVTNIAPTYVWIRTSTKLNATKCQHWNNSRSLSPAQHTFCDVRPIHWPKVCTRYILIILILATGFPNVGPTCRPNVMHF